MKNQRNVLSITIVASLAAILCVFIAVTPVSAQKGDPAVWVTAGLQASGAFIDASAYCGSSCASQDLCNVVNQALHALPAAGGVVDARGVNSGGSNTCANTPYVGMFTITVPSTLLLPSGTITISKTWILPNASKIVGQGTGESGYSVTTLLTGSTFPASNWMIQMGPNSSSANLIKCVSAPLGYCTEIAVEDLALQGPSSANTINGIVNGQAQDMSYVRRVSMYQLGGIGLKVWKGETSNSALDSGPYSDISFDAGTVGSGSTGCAQILNIPTRGIHGLTCKNGSSASAAFAVQIGSSNNSVRDAHISGSFTDGIQVTSAASDTLLFNITGGSNNTYLIHLLSGNSSPNVSIMGASKGGSSGSTNTLFDEMTGTTLQDNFLALYALGTSGVGTNGYSRYTTSTSSNAITWGSGSTAPTTPCTKGSLFSNTSSSGNLYVCTASGTWTPLS